MGSFPITVLAAGTNAESFTTVYTVMPNTDLVLFWGGANAHGYINPSPPTSVTDNNGNNYVLVSGPAYVPYPGSTAMYLCVNPVLTPHNPLTITCTGAMNVPAGGPSIILLGVTVPTSYDVYGANCQGVFPGSGNSLYLNAGTVADVATNPISFDLTPGDNATQVSVTFVNRNSDTMTLLGAYYAETGTPTWGTSGTGVLAYTQETGDGSGHSGAVAYLDASMSSAVCGYNPIPPVTAPTFIVQSVHLTDVNRLKSYKVTCIAGATVGDWKTALKFSINGS